MRPGRSESAGARAAACSSCVGQSDASRKASSVRSRPTPSAPAASPAVTSAAVPALQRSRIFRPSRVTTGSVRSAASSRRRRRRRCTSRNASSSRSWLGSRVTVPAWPSSTTASPSAASRISSPRPTTRGTPSARAMIAAWEVAAPAASASPRILPAARFSSAMSTGPRSRAMRIVGRRGAVVAGAPVSSRAARIPRLRTSAARAASIASSIASSFCACRSVAWRTAPAADVSSARARTSSASAGSSAIKRFASKMSASSTCPSARSRSADSPSSAARLASAARARCCSTSPPVPFRSTSMSRNTSTRPTAMPPAAGSPDRWRSVIAPRRPTARAPRG